jgi:hypothetical protein
LIEQDESEAKADFQSEILYIGKLQKIAISARLFKIKLKNLNRLRFETGSEGIHETISIH